MNTPVNSKINYTALVMALFGIAVTANIIPEEYEEDLTTLVLLGGPVLIFLFRSFWTNADSFMKRVWKKWIG